jgi:excisionase family DNA binding protein
MENAADVLSGKLFASVTEVASVLGYDKRTVRRALEAGEIPGVKPGHAWRIPTSWLLEQARLGAGDAA